MSEPRPIPVPTSEPHSEGELYCLGCGARNDPGAVECWLCNGRALAKGGPGGRPPQSLRPRRFPLSIASQMMLMVAFSASIGLSASAPGLEILLAITIIPAVVLVEAMSARRRRGMPLSGSERPLFFVLFSILPPLLIFAAAIVALFIFCSMGRSR